MQDFGEALRQLGPRLVAAATKGVKEGCDELLSLSRDEVPYDQGDLSNSGLAAVESTPTGAHGAVGFDTPYAIRQHEDPELRHQDGKKARFLGDPLQQNADRLLNHVADTVRRAIE